MMLNMHNLRGEQNTKWPLEISKVRRNSICCDGYGHTISKYVRNVNQIKGNNGSPDAQYSKLENKMAAKIY